VRTDKVAASLTELFAELIKGANTPGEAFVLNSGDLGILRSLDKLSAAEASYSINEGATIAAHAQHLRYGLSLMNRWARKGGDPYADAKWDEAWRTSSVTDHEWNEIRSGLRDEAKSWLHELGESRKVTTKELSGMIATIVHMAYHLGAMRQISKTARGPREGTFS
jgi:hypothetical protein